MSKTHNCLDEILDRITVIEKRLDQLEKDFAGHVLNDNVHVQHKSYRSKSRGPTSPPPPPPGNYKGFLPVNAPGHPKRQSSAPAIMQTPVNAKGHVPNPPPLPDKLRL